jgi:flagellin-like hook-associated protein FlgL
MHHIKDINLLKDGNLNIIFNESRSHKYSINERNMTSEGVGLVSKNWKYTIDIQDSIKELTNAINNIRSFQSELGTQYQVIQTRQNFTESLLNILETGADNLVLADMNEESANYLALQPRQQLAVNSLSLVAQSAQSVLSLF